jgi:hypothetical protein
MTTLVDYSTGPPSAVAIAARHAGAVRYLRKKGHSTVVTLTAAEVTDFQAHNLLLGLAYEDPGAGWMFEGRATGIDRATWALEQARALGFQNPRCIYLCADAHATPDQVARTMECLDGARTVLGRATGIYGFVEVIDAAIAGQHADWFWQTGRRSDVRSGVHLYQRNYETTTIAGITCDIDDVLQVDWGQQSVAGGIWRPAEHLEEDDDMFTFGAPGKPVFFVAGGRAVGLNEASNLTSISSTVALPHLELDDDTYQQFINVFRDGLPSS